ncbi:hypothetical protein HID58_050718, partial [Brassica napus]
MTLSGKCSSFVEARLLRFWEARNVKKGGELMWIDMLLVDVNFDFSGDVTPYEMDTWCCFVSRSRWTKKLQLTVLAFTCVTCNNTNSVGLFRVKFMALKNLVLQGLWSMIFMAFCNS